MKVRIQELDKPNKNGRLYSREVMEKAMQDVKLPIMGQVGFSDNGVLDLTKVSHMVTDLAIEDGYLVGEIKVMNSPQGNVLNRLLDQVEFRTSGYGNVNDDGSVSDFYIHSISAVSKDTAA